MIVTLLQVAAGLGFAVGLYLVLGLPWALVIVCGLALVGLVVGEFIYHQARETPGNVPTSDNAEVS